MKSWKKVELLTKRINELEKQLEDVCEKMESEPPPEKVSRVREFLSRLWGNQEKRVTVQLIVSAVGCALVLGLTIFALVQSFQWRSALAQIRSEPGIEILGVEKVGLFKKRIVGLRDPLAKNVSEILANSGIDPANVEVFLTEYHSLNTPFGKERKVQMESDNGALRDSLVAAVGEFMKNSDNRRDTDLEKITRRLFEIRFPEEMKAVKLDYKNSAWWAEGELLEPAYSKFKTEAPKYIFTGELHFDKLKNLTKTETSLLREGIESLNLFARSKEDGSLVYLPRIRRLVSDYDSVCEDSGIPLPRFQIQIQTDDLPAHREEIESIESALGEIDSVNIERFFPYSAISPDDNTSETRGTLNLILLSSAP